MAQQNLPGITEICTAHQWQGRHLYRMSNNNWSMYLINY